MNLQIVIVGSEKWTSSLKRCAGFIRIKEGRRKHNKAITVEVNPVRGLFFGFFSAIVLYFVAAVGLYFWRVNVPNNHIGFVDILLAPVSMENISRLQGQTNIDNAREQFKRENYVDSFYNYRAGVARIPDDLEARLELAQFYIAAGFVSEATDLLITGLNYGFPKDVKYLQILLATTQVTENYEALRQAIPVLLEFPEVKDNLSLKVALLQLLLKAQLVDNDYAGVMSTSEALNRLKVEKTFYDTALFARLKMGAYVDAENYFNALPEEEKEAADIQLLEGILIYNDRDKQQGIAEFQALFRDYPNEWRNQMDAMLYLYQQGDTRAADTLFNLYLTMHARDPDAMSGLASRLTDLPDPERLEKLILSAAQHQPRLYPPFMFLYLQCLITDGQFEEARKALEVTDRGPPTEGREADIYQAYRLILNAALARSKGEFTELREFMEEEKLPSEVYWEAAEAMRKVGALPTAELILNAGLTLYPYSRALSNLRDSVLKQSRDSSGTTSDILATAKSDVYQTQRLQTTDAIADRLVGHQPATGKVPDSILDDEKFRDVAIEPADFNKAAEVQ